MTLERSDPEQERRLAARFSEGDPAALSETFELHSNEIFRFLYFYTRREDLAEDLTQEVFLRAFAKRRLLVKFTNFRAWLFTIARNLAAKEMKRHRYRLELHLEDIAPDAVRGFAGDTPSASSLAQEDETRRLLAEAVNTLDPESRELLLLRYFSELPLREISELLGIPMGSIGGRLTRALLAVRVHFEKHGLSWKDFGPIK